MLKVKLFGLLLCASLMSGCASTHVASIRDDAASITVQYPRIVEGEQYRPFVAISINGKRVERTEQDFANDPETSFVHARIDHGVIELKIEVTAYKTSRAKYNNVTTSLSLAPNGRYQLTTLVPENVADTINEDSWAEVTLVDMENGNEVFSNRLTLKDNWMRSVPQDQSIIVPIVL
ncbi:MAG: hypothetical protein AAF431_12935 [Pseudomonadota bacterium]